MGGLSNGESLSRECSVMTAEAKHLIDDFAALPDTTKREVLTELVRIFRHLDYPAISAVNGIERPKPAGGGC